jgi:hypothetical protein
VSLRALRGEPFFSPGPIIQKCFPALIAINRDPAFSNLQQAYFHRNTHLTIIF